MPYDSIVLTACIGELEDELIGSRVNKVHQPDEHTLIIRYHGEKGNGRLLLSAHPQNGRIHKCALNRDNPAKAPLFAMVLRKWLEGSRIASFSVTKGERIATLTFDARNELGDNIRLKLVTEIMGKHSNIILVDEHGMILDGIRRYGSHLSRYREVLPGKPYLSPPPMLKLPFLPENEEVLAAALYEAAEESISVALRQKLKGVSPLLSDNIPLFAGLSPDLPVESMGTYEIGLIYKQLQILQKKMDTKDYTPVMTLVGSRYRDYYAFILPSWPEEKIMNFPSVNGVVDAYYLAREQQQIVARHKQRLAKALRQNGARLNKKIALEEADLANCEAASAYREAGDLLCANLYYLAKGQEAVELTAFDDQTRTVRIALDPAKTPQENIQYYYKRYSKAKSARALIEMHLNTNRQELAYLFSIEQALEDSCELEEVEIIEKEAENAGFYQRRAYEVKNKAIKANPVALPPRQYISVDGLTILVGRNNKQNDRLSLKQAKPNDIWLHAQKIPGSHVVIVNEGRDIPERTIMEAAAYAAWFSKARGSGKTPVDYTRAENLKKPNGAVPGYVTYTGQKTVYVEPVAPKEE